MRVAEIRVHPLKSCRPVRRSSSAIVNGALEHDRRYMVVDENGDFVTLRTIPQLSFIDVVIAATTYEVTLPNGVSFALPHQPTGRRCAVTIWGRRVIATEMADAGEHVSDWLGRRLRVVGVGGPEALRILPDHSGGVAFADAWPVLCMSAESVADLSARVGEPMAMDRFRPNVVLDDVPYAYVEDTFEHIMIGDIPFDGTALCSRCVATTIDPVTGVAGHEPLRTLARYRRFGSAVYLGANCVARADGRIQDGDAVRVVRSVDRLPV